MTFLLAQSLFSAPDPLPRAPAMERLLFETPTLLVGAFALLAVVVLIAGVRSGRSARMGLLAGALFLIAGGLFGLSRIVETDREAATRSAAALVRAVAAGDAAGAGELLADSVDVRLGGAGVDGVGRETLLRAVAALGEMDARVTESSAHTPRDGRATAQFRVRSMTEGAPGFSWWSLDARRNDEGVWRVHALECLLINGRRPGALLLGELRRLAR